MHFHWSRTMCHDYITHALVTSSYDVLYICLGRARGVRGIRQFLNQVMKRIKCS